MVHRNKYGCDLSTSEEEQVDAMRFSCFVSAYQRTGPDTTMYFVPQTYQPKIAGKAAAETVAAEKAAADAKVVTLANIRPWLCVQ